MNLHRTSGLISSVHKAISALISQKLAVMICVINYLGCVALTSFNFEPGSNLNLNLVQA